MLWAGCTVLGVVVSVLPLAADTARAGPVPTDSLGRTDPAHTDVLFVGAHPDDESSSLATFGQWQERRGLSTGVVTITRGEGGGNAVGTEEGQLSA